MLEPGRLHVTATELTPHEVDVWRCEGSSTADANGIVWKVIGVFRDREGDAEWKELNVILGRSRRKLLRRCHRIEGVRLAELCPLAEQIIQDDPYMSKQAIMDSGPSSFGGRLREDAFFVRNSFERQFNTLNEVIWMLVYRAISLETNTGPYVIQIPNFEIRNVGGIRTVHQVGWCELTRNGEVTKRGAILLLWLADIGELCEDGHRYLHHFVEHHPGPFEVAWQHQHM